MVGFAMRGNGLHPLFCLRLPMFSLETAKLLSSLVPAFRPSVVA